MTDERIKRGPGRPKIERVSGRPERPSTGRSRGKLYVTGTNPDYTYYWAVDTAENGYNIFDFRERGWEFSTKENDPNIKIGDLYVHTVENVGSVYRVPANKKGEYHYLMRIRKEWADEDFMRQQQEVDEKESGIFRADKGDGQYGGAHYE